MGRTKLTARKSTGGKRPRQQLADYMWSCPRAPGRLYVEHGALGLPKLPLDSWLIIQTYAPTAASFQQLRCANNELKRLSDAVELEDTRQRLRWRRLISKKRAFLQHTYSVNCCAFSPDGARVVTALLDDKTARIWDA